MKHILAIDPGNTESAFVEMQGNMITSKGKIDNSKLLEMICEEDWAKYDYHLYIEMVASYGMPVGREVFDTCVWIGRFMEAWDQHNNLKSEQVFRKEIKIHHCGSMRAKDSNIIQALKDKYGDKGTKKNPGYFFGVNADVWQAFALASYVMEKEAS